MATAAAQSNSFDSRFDIFSSSFNNIEIADDEKRAILTIPLMHVGPNKKGLYWTEKMLKEIAPMFRGIVFKYDVQGREGSSHVLKKMFSPYYDVGWTYDGIDGAWYDSNTKTLWVKGEATHPEVIEKLLRENSQGKRELNYASMGVMVQNAKCSVCGHDEGECSHERNKVYDEGTCYSIPTKIAKALHVALTNDPADGEAEISKCVFQELSVDDYRMSANKFENQRAANKVAGIQNINDKVVNNMNDVATPYSNGDQNNPYTKGNQTRQDNMHEQMGVPSMIESNQMIGNQGQPANQMLGNQMPNGMAPGQNQTGMPGESPSSETILQALAERIKTIEQKVDAQTMVSPAPELLNTAPQDQMTQDNMGVTTQFEQQPEANNMNLAKGQNTQEKVPVNPPAVETQEMGAQGGEMQQIMQMLQQILQRLPQVATQDAGELIETKKGVAKKSQDDIPTEHAGPGDAVGDNTDEGNKKNVKHMNEPGMVATADDTLEDEKDEVENLKTEVADMKAVIEKMKGSLEFADSNIPEFGGSGAASGAIEIADMSAAQRREKFGGTEGAMDAIFNGAESARRFIK